jgi:hypothetical protein
VKIRVHSWFYSAPPGQDAILTYSCVNPFISKSTPMNEFIGCQNPNLINQVHPHPQPASAGLGFCEASVLTDADIRLVICRGWRIENNEFLGKTEFIPCHSVLFRGFIRGFFRAFPCYSVALFVKIRVHSWFYSARSGQDTILLPKFSLTHQYPQRSRDPP